jgi:peroxisomal 2,4-dienoyl-CoA reductase
LDRFTKEIPLQRLGSRDDIGNAVLYLASPAASYVTGTILVVDGGSWLTEHTVLDAMPSKL